LINLPDWVRADRFDIVAKYPGRTVLDPRDAPAMVRSLLADRFALHAHEEKRELSVFALVLARRDHELGPSLRPSTETSGVRRSPGITSAHSVPIGLLVLTLSGMVQRLVVDRTGLTGLYDFELHWGPEVSATLDAAPP